MIFTDSFHSTHRGSLYNSGRESPKVNCLSPTLMKIERIETHVCNVRFLGLMFLIFLSALNGAEVLEILHENCARCHGKGGKVKGKVNLLEIADLDHLKGDPELLQEIIDALDFEEMPPEDEPHLKWVRESNC